MSSTDLLISNFNRLNNSFSISQWVHDHPTQVKTLRVAAAFFGIAGLATAPFLVSAAGLGVAYSVGILGGFSLLAALANFLVLKYATCAASSMDVHAFKKGECEGGRLYYKGNIPILELDGNSYQAGFAHGRLLGSHIYELRNNMDLLLHATGLVPRARKVRELLAEVRATIPDAYQTEMEGLKDGYNAWATEAGVATSIDVDDILLCHLIADSKHFHLKNAEGMACTTLLYRDPVRGVIAGRNMDWMPFGSGGKKSLVVVWKRQNIAAVGIPGLIGVITGWNKDGVFMSMNVAPGKTESIRGTPSMLYNRSILAQSSSVQRALSKVQRVRPLGPYHLILADRRGDGASVSFYQGRGEGDYIRRLKDGKPLVTLNWKYPECQKGFFKSEKREVLLKHYFSQAKKTENPNWKKIVANALTLSPLVNSWITLHSLLFIPDRDEAWIAWDNGYAGSMRKRPMKMSKVF